MCSFMVYTKNDIKKEDFLKEFQKISYRGPDMTKTDFWISKNKKRIN